VLYRIVAQQREIRDEFLVLSLEDLEPFLKENAWLQKCGGVQVQSASYQGWYFDKPKSMSKAITKLQLLKRQATRIIC
jgi:predicted house-cleaning NTP pyrophosphatase (Maf/HAM1 superfamily)